MCFLTYGSVSDGTQLFIVHHSLFIKKRGGMFHVKQRYWLVLRWVFYGFFILFVALLQTVFLGNSYFFGTKLSLFPIGVVAVACQCDHESSGFFALGAALFWSFLGQDNASGYCLFLPLAAMVSGWICSHYLTRGWGATFLLAVGCLLLCEGGLILVRLYMNLPLPADHWVLLGKQVLFSSLFAPLFWLVASSVERTVLRWKLS